MIWERCAWVTDATYNKYMSRGLPAPGDLVFTTEAPMGEVAMAPEEKFCMAQRMMLLKPDPSVWLPEYLMYHLRSPWFQANLRLSSTGTTVQGVSSRNFRPLKIFAPSLEVQTDLILRINEGLVPLQRLQLAADTNSERSRRLQASILRSAFSGQLVPRNPNDEPAAELLDRIASERPKSHRETRRAKVTS